MTRLFSMATVLAVLVFGGLALQGQNQTAVSPDVLLGQALHEEQAEGRLEQAIATYMKVLAAPGATREQKARAQFRIGACYERLGMSEASKAYEAVVSNYADLGQLAAQARARLAGLNTAAARSGASAGPAMRLIPGSVDWYEAHISPDGRHLAFIDAETMNVNVRDLTTGSDSRLTEVPKDRVWEDEAMDVRWSPDGRRIAYSWFTASTCELRILDVSTRRATSVRGTEASACIPVEWSPDGSHILAGILPSGKGGAGLAWVSIAHGLVRRLPGTEAAWNLPAAVSPDGRFVAYSTPASLNASDRDVMLLSLADGRSRRLLEGPEDDRVVAWHAGTGRLILKSSRSGSEGLWAVTVNGEEPVGLPELIRDKIGMTSELGLSRDGTLAFEVRKGIRQILVADYDAANDRLQGVPRRIPQSGDNHSCPSWSPDGRTLAFWGAPGSRRLSVLTFAENLTRNRQFVLARSGAGCGMSFANAWSGDGRSLYTILIEADSAYPAGSMASTWQVARFEAATGEESRIGPKVARPASIVGVSRDGRTLYERRNPPDTQRVELIAVDAATRAETLLYRSEVRAGIVPVALSPDGRLLAFQLNLFDGGRQVFALPATGGTPRPLFMEEMLSSLTWTSDSKLIVYVKGIGSGTKATFEAWTFEIASGRQRKIEGISLPYIRSAVISPDGRQIAFEAATEMPATEVWLLENFLPAAKTGTKPKPEARR